MLPQSVWLKNHGHTMDRRLRRELFERLAPPHWWPCFLQRGWFQVAMWLVRVHVIVEVPSGHSAVAHLTRETGCRHAQWLPVVGCCAMQLRARQLERLCQCEAAGRIWLDARISALPAGAQHQGLKRPLSAPDPTAADPAATRAGSPPYLGAQLAAVHAADVTGRGVAIAILDTGIHPHQDFTAPANRIVGFKDLVGSRTRPYDDNGHGTHVAGCAAGNGASAGGEYRGAAPTAGIVAIKVLDKRGAGRLSALVSGMQWAIDHATELGIRVVSLSLGMTAGPNDDADPMEMAVAAAWSAGLIVCCAAGNEGPDAGTISSPGTTREAITVGALDDLGTESPQDDRIAGFSSRGPTLRGLIKPDVLAPGVDIVAPRSPGSFLDKQTAPARVGADYLQLSGTSMATPVVSGLCACLLQVRPGTTPVEMKQHLRTTALDLGLPSTDQGAGAVQGAAALQAWSAV